MGVNGPTANGQGKNGRAMRERLERHGLKVVCVECGARCRHFQARGRLREKACPRCYTFGRLKAQHMLARAGAPIPDLCSPEALHAIRERNDA